MGERLRERWEFCFWERENEWNRGGKKEIEKKEGRNIILTRGGNKKYYLLLVHYKNFSYTTTNIAYFLYMVSLKITI